MKRQMRIISMAMTAKQFVNGTKDVTRRVGWKHAKVGMRLRVVEKAMGLQKGERMKTLGFIELTNVRSEPLSLMLNGAGGYGSIECAREGFPKWTPEEFIGFFCDTHAVKPHAHVTRLEFKKIDIDDGRTEELPDVEAVAPDADRADANASDGSGESPASADA